jgi:hypothetical protein
LIKNSFFSLYDWSKIALRKKKITCRKLTGIKTAKMDPIIPQGITTDEENIAFVVAIYEQQE